MGQKQSASQADHYRRRVEEIREQAKSSPSEAARRELEAIARHYERIALDLARLDRHT